MSPWLLDFLKIAFALLIVAINGFFVAAEFALVKVRGSRLEQLVEQDRPFARTAQWLAEHLDGSLSACQLGITMASLGLGWIGEPAFARVLEPILTWVGIESAQAIHAIAFTVAFTTISALHLVVGEQAPKILAIRRPERLILWCAGPLKGFYIISYPLLEALNLTTAFILRKFGIEDTDEHDAPHSEQEIRALLTKAHLHGDVTGSEHRLINAVFNFDEIVSRQVMSPRSDVEFFDVSFSYQDCIEIARRTKHTRFPLVEGQSLDQVIGIIHMKDLIGVDSATKVDLRDIARPPKIIPDNMPISRLLRFFQAARQHMAFVVNEHGTMLGIVTLENVLEQIVGPVEDEFDQESPNIVPEDTGHFLVAGSTPLEEVNRRLNLRLKVDPADPDTFSGFLMQMAGRIPEAGDEFQLPGATAEVVESRFKRAERIRVIVEDDSSGSS